MNRFFISEEKSSAGKYRYGFNGMEKDDEVKGEGNSYTTYYRSLDTRLGRWLSIDPKASKFPWQTPYCSMDNNPILFNDPLGDDVGYRKTGDRIRVGLGRVFSKKVRNDFKARKKSNDLFIYSYDTKSPILRDAKSTKFIGGPYGNTNVVKYSMPGGGVPPIPIKFYKHDFTYDVEKYVTREETTRSNGRTTESSKRVGQLQNILINTKARPDMITVADKGGNYLGGTEDASGTNAPMVTRSNRFAMDSRSNRSWVTIPSAGSVKGKILVISTTPTKYFDLQSGSKQTNYSAWEVKLQGKRSFGIYLPWPQKQPVKFNDKGF